MSSNKALLHMERHFFLLLLTFSCFVNAFAPCSARHTDGLSLGRSLLQDSAGELYEEVVKALLDGNIPAAGDLMKTGIQKGQAAEIASAISAAAAAGQAGAAVKAASLAMANGADGSTISSALSIAIGRTTFNVAPTPAIALPPAASEVAMATSKNNTGALSTALSDSSTGRQESIMKANADTFNKAQDSITRAISDSVAQIKRDESADVAASSAAAEVAKIVAAAFSQAAGNASMQGSDVNPIDSTAIAAATSQAAANAISEAFGKAALDQLGFTVSTRAEDFQRALSLAFATVQAFSSTSTGGAEAAGLNSAVISGKLTKGIGASLAKVLAQISGELELNGGPAGGTRSVLQTVCYHNVWMYKILPSLELAAETV